MRIQIEKVANGWIVQAGCTTLVFHENQSTVLADEFARWLDYPQQVEQEYVKKYGGVLVAPPSGGGGGIEIAGEGDTPTTRDISAPGLGVRANPASYRLRGGTGIESDRPSRG